MRSFTIAIIFLALISSVYALPIELHDVEIDGIDLAENALNRLSLLRGEEYEVQIRFTPRANLTNVELRAFISGYEYNDVTSVEDRIPVFDADEGVTYAKKLIIIIPDELDKDSYKLRVIISDRYNDERIAHYNLQVDAPRNALKIDDVIFNPSESVRSGSALLTKVRLENKGEREQEDVKVTVAIPGLGVSGAQYIDIIEAGDDEEETEEIYLRIPRCAKGGAYDVNIEVEFLERNRKIIQKKTINVIEDETCASEQIERLTTVTPGSALQTISAGGTAIFPITITNTARTAKTFVVSADAEWASLSITPTNTLVIPAGHTQTAFVNVQTSEETKSGTRAFVATIQSEKTQEQATFSVNVLPEKNKGRLFEYVLIALLIILAILAVIVILGYMRDQEKEQTYY